ncbi:hypothetical protein PUN28_001489 [Cardiocondyla obscurior]|uniref:Endosome-associated-trafficking regulator 1 n=1 Tax=Cardiocondyla obscurior TaxID=286306 RepID=A0AAW2H5K6_9HYME
MASRKRTDNSSRRSSLPQRHLWPSSSDEEDEAKTSKETRGSSRVETCKNLPSTSKNEDVFKQLSPDEEKMVSARPDAQSRNNPSPKLDRFNRSRINPAEHSTDQDVPSRRDNNPFSFKAFLKNGTQQTNYQNTGARPKVYSTSSSSSSSSSVTVDNDNVGSVYSARNPTKLPDFVQDHLVIEQCYLNHDPVLPDVDCLPDFAQNSMQQMPSRWRNETKKNGSDNLCDDLQSFDLTDTLHKNVPHRDHSAPNEINSFVSNHLNLPLPYDYSKEGGIQSIGEESSVPNSLPDFLSDGPIHTDSDPNNSLKASHRTLVRENATLREAFNVVQGQFFETLNRLRSLEAELSSKKKVEHEEAVHLEKAIEQVEDNLKRSTKRAVDAESTVISLKKEIKTLTAEISLLRLENSELRASTSTTGQNAKTNASANMNRTIRRLARDLFAAASSAEVSLRQLMSGVDNLRVLASTLENVDRIEDWTKDFLSDSDEDNATGPAV